jgi:hypothetical protein
VEAQRARASDDAGSFITFGLGNETCVAWLDARRTKNAKAIKMEAWAQGFVTSYNKYVHDGVNVLPEMNDDKLSAALDRHCSNRGRDSLWFAINALMEQANKKNSRGGLDSLMDLFKSGTRGK